MMTLNSAPLNKKLLVSHITDTGEELDHLQSRLMHLGFIKNEPVLLIQKAPYFGVPLLVEVKGRRIALSFDEAELVIVTEVSL